MCAIHVQGFQKMLHLSGQAQHFGDLHRHFAWQAQRFRHVVQIRPVQCGKYLRVRCSFFLDSQRFTHFTLRTLHFYTLCFTLRTPHSTLCALHFPLHTLHLTLRTVHFTRHALHLALRAIHYTPHTLYTLHSALHTLQHTTLYNLRFALDTPHSTLYTLQFTLYT